MAPVIETTSNGFLDKLAESFNLSINSSVNKAFGNLGFQEDQQVALLNIFNMAGYFKPEMVWAALCRSKIFDNPDAIFKLVMPLLEHYGANGKAEDFDAKGLVDNLFSNLLDMANTLTIWKDVAIVTSQINDENVAKFILYVAQNAFARKAGQERCDIEKASWMNGQEEQYWANAKKLGMTDSINPDQIYYDATIILGASRPGVYARLVELNHYVQSGLTSTGPIFITAGKRPLWAELDGLQPEIMQLLEEAQKSGLSIDNIAVKLSSIPPSNSVQEGQEYLVELADKLDIKYDTENPFKVEQIQGKARHYLNSEIELNETMMSEDLMSKFDSLNAIIVDTQKFGDGQRPNTVSTVEDVAKYLIQNIARELQESGKSEFHYMVVSNNPYIERQVIASQRMVDAVLKKYDIPAKATLHGVGFGAKQDIEVIHSELAALISEKFKDAYPEEKLRDLLYSSRDKDGEIPDMPVLGEAIYEKDVVTNELSFQQ